MMVAARRALLSSDNSYFSSIPKSNLWCFMSFWTWAFMHISVHLLNNFTRKNVQSASMLCNLHIFKWHNSFVSGFSAFKIFIRPSSDGTYYSMVMSVRVSVRPTLRPSGSPSARFPHFYPTCFDILSWNFAHDFVLMYYRSSSSVVILRKFLKELCLFVNLEYRKCAVFRTFLLHALTYWAEILHMTLFYCITDQVRVSPLCFNF